MYSNSFIVILLVLTVHCFVYTISLLESPDNGSVTPAKTLSSRTENYQQNGNVFNSVFSDDISIRERIERSLNTENKKESSANQGNEEKKKRKRKKSKKNKNNGTNQDYICESDRYQTFIRSLTKGYVYTGKITMAEVTDLQTLSPESAEFRNALNQLFTSHGLQPLPSCMSEFDSSMTSKTSDKKVGAAARCRSNEYVKGVNSLLKAYKKKGLLSGKELKTARASIHDDKDFDEVINVILANNNLDALPQCSKTRATTVAIIPTTTEKATAPMSSTTEDTTEKATAPMPSTTEDTTEKATAPMSSTTEDSSEPLLPCWGSVYNAKMTTAFMGWTISGKLPFSESIKVRDFGIANPNFTMEYTNYVLAVNGLPPLPPCIRRYPETQPPRDKDIMKMSCDSELYEISIVSILQAYRGSGDLSIADMEIITSALQEDSDIIPVANELLDKYNLDPLPPCAGDPLCKSSDYKSVALPMLSQYLDDGSLSKEEYSIITDAYKSSSSEFLSTSNAILADHELDLFPPCIMQQIVKVETNSTDEDGMTMEEKMQALNNAIRDGFLPSNTLELLRDGIITEEWLRYNMTHNRDLIISNLPEKLQAMIHNGTMPKDVEDAILSGNYSKPEIENIIISSDDFFKALMPEQLVLALRGKPVPYEIRTLFLSGKNESEITAMFMTNQTVSTLMFGESTAFFIALFSDPANQAMSSWMNALVLISLTCVMISLGCTITAPQLAKHAKNPMSVIIGLSGQFVVMPACAFGLTQLFSLETYAAIAVLICGCCPGGNLSNVLSYMLNGDMNLSILMTTCSAILGLALMPFNIWLYSRFIVSVGTDAIPYDKIIISIALTVIPVVIGILIRHYKSHWVNVVTKGGFIILMVCSVAVGVLAGLVFEDSFFRFFPVELIAVCAILPMAGYLFGFIIAYFTGQSMASCRTISVETGCQNVQLCTTVLRLAFDQVLVGVIFLMPLMYMMCQTFEAFFLIFMYKCVAKIKGKDDTDDDDSEDTEKAPLNDNSNAINKKLKENDMLMDESPSKNLESFKRNRTENNYV